MLIRLILIAFACFTLANSAMAQTTTVKEMLSFCDSAFQKGYVEEQFPGLTATVVKGDSIFYLNSGVLDIKSGQLVNSTSLFQLGSIGKVLTSIAVLQLVDAGKIDLYADINLYLPFDVVNPYNSHPSTLIDLLTHSVGLNDRNIGYMAKDTASLESLQQHLQKHLPSFFQASGKEINYSNYSYGLAGLIVENVSGVSFNTYLNQNVFQRIGMKDSFVGVSSEFDGSYAKGYQVVEGHFIETKNLPRHAIPAGSFVSNAIDMGKLLQAFIYRSDNILSEASWLLLTTRVFTNDDHLPGYSLGLEEQNINGYTFWAKGGMLKGLLSHMVFLPDSTAIFISMNTSQDEFLEQFYEGFISRFFPDISKSSQRESINIDQYLGEYTNGRYDREGMESLVSLFSGANNIYSSNSGNLLIWHNGSMNEYEYIGNDVFEHTSKPYLKIVFRRDHSGKVNRMYRGVNIGGMSIPTTFEKTKWYNSPSFINEDYGIVLLGIVIYAIPILFFLLVQIIRRYKPDFWKFSLLPWYYYLTGTVMIFILFVHIFGVIMRLMKNSNQFLIGYPEGFMLTNSTAYLFAFMVIVCLFLSIKSITKSIGSYASRITFCLMTMCSLFHAWALWYWNFI